MSLSAFQVMESCMNPAVWTSAWCSDGPLVLPMPLNMCNGLSTTACLGCTLTDGFWSVSVTWPYPKWKIGFYSIFRWFSVPQTLPQQRIENMGGICILQRQRDQRVPCGTKGWRQLPRAGEVVMDGQASQGVCTILAEALFNSFEPLWWFPLA